MKTNYFTVHKNKKPKKAKYSNPYTKLEKENFENCIQDFNKRIELIRGTAMVAVNANQNTIDALNKMAKIAYNLK
jgi:hypothetical protein